MATIMMSSAKIILKVKKISSIKAGSGSTSNEITMSTAAGIARDVANVSAEPLLRKCRKFVKILRAKSTLMPYRQLNSSIAPKNWRINDKFAGSVPTVSFVINRKFSLKNYKNLPISPVLT